MEAMNVYKQIINEVKEAKRIVITSHRSPDGDSIGSSLGLYHFLLNMGKEVVVCHPDAAPHFLTWVAGAHDILIFDEKKEEVEKVLSNADLVFCLDYNSSDRVGKEMEVPLLTSEARKVMIDHHMHPADFCEIVVSDTSVCSTSQLIFELIDQSGNLDLLDDKVGTPLYLGIMTDTGSFRFPSVQPRTHEILRNLLLAGVKHWEVHEKVLDTNTVDRLRLRGYAVSEKMELMKGFPVAIISLTAEELDRFNYRKGDTDALVNVALSVEGIRMAAFFMERENQVKISFRSKGDCFVNMLAADHFEGGGHKYASGGVSFDDLETAISKFKKVVPNYLNS